MLHILRYAMYFFLLLVWPCVYHTVYMYIHSLLQGTGSLHTYHSLFLSPKLACLRVPRAPLSHHSRLHSRDICIAFSVIHPTETMITLVLHFGAFIFLVIGYFVYLVISCTATGTTGARSTFRPSYAETYQPSIIWNSLNLVWRF